MTINERIEFKKKGIEVLRPMFDHRKQMWKIMKCTIIGGWTRFGTCWHFTKELALVKIDALVQCYPNDYKSDN